MVLLPSKVVLPPSKIVLPPSKMVLKVRKSWKSTKKCEKKYWFRVLSLKFCGKSKKICGDISPQSPAFCMYAEDLCTSLTDTNPTHIATEFVLWQVGFASFEVLCVFDQFPGLLSPSAGNCTELDLLKISQAWFDFWTERILCAAMSISGKYSNPAFNRRNIVQKKSLHAHEISFSLFVKSCQDWRLPFA